MSFGNYPATLPLKTLKEIDKNIELETKNYAAIIIYVLVVRRKWWIIKEVYSCSLEWREARRAHKVKGKYTFLVLKIFFSEDNTWIL